MLDVDDQSHLAIGPAPDSARLHVMADPHALTDSPPDALTDGPTDTAEPRIIGSDDHAESLEIATDTTTAARTTLFVRFPESSLFSTDRREGSVSRIEVGGDDRHGGSVRPDEASTLFMPDQLGSPIVHHRISSTGRLCDLPIFARYAFDPRRLRHVSSCRRLTDLDPMKVVEVTCVGSPSGSLDDRPVAGSSDHGLTVDLLARMLRSALVEGHRMWLIAPTDPLIPFITDIAGHDAVHKVGRRRLGSQANAGPWAVDPLQLTTHLLDVEPGDERHWVTVTLRNALEGVRTESCVTDRDLRARGVHTDRPRLRGRIRLPHTAAVATMLLAAVCIISPAIHIVVYRKTPPVAPLTVIACLIAIMTIGMMWGRHRRSREARELRQLLTADSVIDRVEVDRGEVQVL